MQTQLAVIVFVMLATVSATASSPLKVELLSARKIWDQSPHNAFTDLTRWQDQFYCAFREGRGHVSTDGKIRVIHSADGETWTSAAQVELPGFDLRDAHLSVTPDHRLMLLGGAAPREKDGQGAPTGSFVAFSTDGVEWSKPQIVVEPGRWLWSVTWHKNRAYGVSYPASEGSPDIELLASTDGVTYQSLVPKLYGVG
ncbi:MAG: exo-alpha-sialidase, partial [Phycisphaerales bacterium]